LILYSLNEKIENIDKEEKKYKIFTKLIEEIKALGKKEI
jgi:hypothetical protein